MAGPLGAKTDQEIGRAAHLTAGLHVAFGTGRVHAQVEDTEIRKSEDDMNDTIVAQTPQHVKTICEQENRTLTFHSQWPPTCHNSLTEANSRLISNPRHLILRWQPLDFEKQWSGHSTIM